MSSGFSTKNKQCRSLWLSICFGCFGSWRSIAQIPKRRGKQTKAGVQPEAPAVILTGWLCSPNEGDRRIWWAVMLSDTTEQGLWQLSDGLATKDNQGWLGVWIQEVYRGTNKENSEGKGGRQREKESWKIQSRRDLKRQQKCVVAS